MSENGKDLHAELEECRRKVLTFFREGREIHNAYQAAPDGQSLTEEVEKFTAKLNEGLAELNNAELLRKK